jgi:endonuclease YncB( thermonuclease family)
MPYVLPSASAAALVAALAAAPLPAEPACLGETTSVRAAAVADARTVVLQDGRALRVAGIESFALLGVDADEAEATMRARLEAAVAGVPLRFRLLSAVPDRYGRLPALLAPQDGPPVQEMLARAGHAIAFAGGEAMPCFAEILAAEDEARREQRGFWAGRELPQADPEALAGRIGRFAIFEGTVISVGNRPLTTYLNFGTSWLKDVTAEIDAGDRDRFGGEAALAALAGKRLRVRGFLQEASGPVAILRSPMQIEVLENAEPTAKGSKP